MDLSQGPSTTTSTTAQRGIIQRPFGSSASKLSPKKEITAKTILQPQSRPIRLQGQKVTSSNEVQTSSHKADLSSIPIGHVKLRPPSNFARYGSPRYPKRVIHDESLYASQSAKSTAGPSLPPAPARSLFDPKKDDPIKFGAQALQQQASTVVKAASLKASAHDEELARFPTTEKELMTSIESWETADRIIKLAEPDIRAETFRGPVDLSKLRDLKAMYARILLREEDLANQDSAFESLLSSTNVTRSQYIEFAEDPANTKPLSNMLSRYDGSETFPGVP